MSITHPETNGQPATQWDLGAVGFPTSEAPRPQDAVTNIYGDQGVPDPHELQEALEVAKAALPLQRELEGLGVLSQEQLRIRVEQNRRHDDAWLQQRDLDHAAAIEQREEDREREKKLTGKRAEHEHKMEETKQNYELEAVEADQEQQRLLNPVHEVRRAHHCRKWLPKLALVPAGVAAAVSAVNLATQGARVLDVPTMVGAGLGAGLDLVFTVGLVAIVLGRMSGLVTLGKNGHSLAYLAGEIGLGLGLGAASVMAHHLPSADGSPHNAALGWWFLLLPAAFAFSTIFAPMLQEDTTKRFIFAGRDAQLSKPYGGLDSQEAKAVRLARWIAEQDRAGNIAGDRDAAGLPSVKKIEQALRDRLGSCANPLARQVKDYYAILSGAVD